MKRPYESYSARHQQRLKKSFSDCDKIESQSDIMENMEVIQGIYC